MLTLFLLIKGFWGHGWTSAVIKGLSVPNTRWFRKKNNAFCRMSVAHQMFRWRSEIIIRMLVFMQRVHVRCLLTSQLLQPIDGSAFWHERLQLCGTETLPDCRRLHPKSTDCVRLHLLWCWPLLLYFYFILFFYMYVIKKSAIDRQRCGFWVVFFFFFQ